MRAHLPRPQRRRQSPFRRLRVEPLEPRLALTWLGVPPVGITPPSSTAASVTLNAQADASGNASISSTEVDYYSFTATRSGAYVISATTPSSNVDTVLGVFSASGQRLAYNDDITSGVNTDSRLTINMTVGARYYVGITNYSSASRGSYVWSINGPNATLADDAYENNDSFGTASNLGTLSATRTIGQLVMADTQDWYRFTTTATAATGSNVSIAFQNSQGNLQLALYDASGNLLGASQGTGNSETVSLDGRAAGTYYVVAFGNSGATNPNYSLTVALPAAQTITPPAAGGFQITLSMSGLTASQQAIFQQAAARWSQVIVGDLPNATYRGQVVDDLLINASATAIDGVNGILGEAGPDAFRSGSMLPYHGVMEFDSADLASMESRGLLLSVVMHEMGHVLGIGTIWESLGLLAGAGTSNPIFVGTNATAAYDQLFGTSASGVPVENTGGPGTADGHWRESVFTNELMTGWAGPGTNLPLSVVTVGSLADIGYSVNYAAADTYIRSLSASALSSLTSSAASRRSLQAAGVSVAIASLDMPSANTAAPLKANRLRVAGAIAMILPPDPAIVDVVMENNPRFNNDSGAPLTSSDAYSSAWEQLGWDGLGQLPLLTPSALAAS